MVCNQQGKTKILGEKTCPKAILSTKNRTRSGLGLDPGICGDWCSKATLVWSRNYVLTKRHPDYSHLNQTASFCKLPSSLRFTQTLITWISVSAWRPTISLYLVSRLKIHGAKYHSVTHFYHAIPCGTTMWMYQITKTSWRKHGYIAMIVCYIFSGFRKYISGENLIPLDIYPQRSCWTARLKLR